jgi:hypothetical protein
MDFEILTLTKIVYLCDRGHECKLYMIYQNVFIFKMQCQMGYLKHKILSYKPT